MNQRRIRAGAFSRLLACAVVVSGSTVLVCLAPMSARGASVVGAEGALDTSFGDGGRLLDWRGGGGRGGPTPPGPGRPPGGEKRVGAVGGGGHIGGGPHTAPPRPNP